MFYGMRSSPIAYKSWKIKEVCTSTMHAELIPVVKAIQAIIYQINLLKELRLPVRIPVNIYTDSQALIDTIDSKVILKGSRHFLFRINYIKQMIGTGIITLKKIPGEQNVADLLTKPEDKTTHLKNAKAIFQGLQSI